MFTNIKLRTLLFSFVIFSNIVVNGQNNQTVSDKDSLNNAALTDYADTLTEIENQRHSDSIKKMELEAQFNVFVNDLMGGSWKCLANQAE